MDMTITIYKQDGTRQCENIAPRPIAEDAGAITALGVHIVGEGTAAAHLRARLVRLADGLGERVRD